MTLNGTSVLVLCYGNPARLDDGLGPALGEKLSQLAGHHLRVETNYQLMVEDSTLMAEHDLVLFVDASMTGRAPYSVSRVAPGEDATFSTHSIGPENLVALTEKVFERKITAYAIAIRGYLFGEFGERLSDEARRNMNSTLEFLLGRSREHSLPSLLSRLGEETSKQLQMRRMRCKTASM